ncbi:hypothetical protein KUTeg_012167 [Tegillarca granosa]|uniref:Uncharacterized protein n=1 Tax=Tegillarca granosa TaxID=220873 RepID=A0ABQ9F335_TEGGR|nr:hypothetical protein KUTeg_012167 [Tegillarca granosa]
MEDEMMVLTIDTLSYSNRCRNSITIKTAKRRTKMTGIKQSGYTRLKIGNRPSSSEKQIIQDHMFSGLYKVEQRYRRNTDILMNTRETPHMITERKTISVPHDIDMRKP